MADTQHPGDEDAMDSRSGYETAGAADAAGPFVTTSGLSVVGEGRYRLTRRLGRGGMAEVYAAEDQRLGRTVAIKVLRSELAEDSIARARFTREAHSVAALNHHAVVAVYDTGEEARGNETVPYIVMELVEGHTVRELLQSEEPPPVDQALIITAGILEALAYSHKHGIVHRDIKPANVIITNSGAVKVMDFGIARALTGATATMTQTGMVMGTPQYLSPEQALGKAVDHRSDLYATGCMLYELLTLRPPFTGDTPLSVVYQHVQDMPVPPSQANPRVPAVLDALVMRALAKEPDDRFQSADEFRAHIQHALRQMHGGTGPTQILGQVGRVSPTAPTAMVPSATGDDDYLPTTVLGAATPPQPMPAAGGGGVGSALPPTYDDHYDDEGAGRSRRGLFAVIATLVVVAAVAVGVALAMNSGNGSGSGGAPGSSQSPTVTQTNSPSQTPSPSITPSQSDTPSYSPSYTPSYSPSYSPSFSPSTSPSTTPSTTPSDTASTSPSAPATSPSTPSSPTSTDHGTPSGAPSTGSTP